MRTGTKRDVRLFVAALAAFGLVGCIPEGEGPPDTPAARACRETIQAKTEALKAAGVDVDGWSIQDATQMKELVNPGQQTTDNYLQFDGRYRPLTSHPGCTVENLYYDTANTQTGAGRQPYVDGNNDQKWTGNTGFGGVNQATGHLDGDKAVIPGYPCAAKEYTQANEDTSKPIVILVHGNSTRPHTWEKFLLPAGRKIASGENTQFEPDTVAREQLADKLIAARYKVIAVDFRTDVVNAIEPSSNNNQYNLAGNIDHGWATPILQSLVKAVMKNNPDRKVALIGHSLGATVLRDALRRLYVEHRNGVADAINPFPHVSHVILASGANQGVSTYDAPYTLCAQNKTMRGTIVCEMGSRSAYTQTYFHAPLNGPEGLFSTPCADGDYAFGKTGECENNVVKYYTITMRDIQSGANYQDLYVSEAAARLNMEGCATNTLTTLQDYDRSGYFLNGLIANHFGSVRSDAGLALVMKYLAE